MTDAVEKVARAVWSFSSGTVPHVWDDRGDCAGPCDEQRDFWLAAAKEVLSALTPGTRFTLTDGREMVVAPVRPTVDMEVAGTEAWLCEGATEDRAHVCYTAMIAEASEAK